MTLYTDYLKQIEERKAQELSPKPIEDAEMVEVLIEQILDKGHKHRKGSLDFFIYNVLPGTTSAASIKAEFLKKIILGTVTVAEITPEFAFELLSHMKGGPSVKVLIDLALGDDQNVAFAAADVLKTQTFLYGPIQTGSKLPIRQKMLSPQTFSPAMPMRSSSPSYPMLTKRLKLSLTSLRWVMSQLTYSRPAQMPIPALTVSFTANVCSSMIRKSRQP